MAAEGEAKSTSEENKPKTVEEEKPASKKHRGIPEAVFLDDVDSFMKNESAEVMLKKLDEQHQKYKFMEASLAAKKRRLQTQVPDIRSTLDIVRVLKTKKEPITTKFLLSDNVYADAKVPPTEKVCLWLGANVMLEYDINEADELLDKNLEMAVKSLEDLEEDLNFLRDQYTTTEVNMARVYNWDVKRRQSEGKKA